MTYTRQYFTDGQVLTASQLNHMEEGIALALSERLVPVDGAEYDQLANSVALDSDTHYLLTSDAPNEGLIKGDIVKGTVFVMNVIGTSTGIVEARVG